MRPGSKISVPHMPELVQVQVQFDGTYEDSRRTTETLLRPVSEKILQTRQVGETSKKVA